MKLFLLEGNQQGYDVSHGFVIAAKNEPKAREIAAYEAESEGSDSRRYWLRNAKCRVIAVRTTEPEGIILHDYLGN
jgi:hypothetical protein